ncbi:hypothetical protein C2134_16720 [Chromobacterium sinusclupearum]|uniref:Uncharacterized protein n=1 Tax=Chromobacterium sinusclupearum TaxID=2077146 RepID=A0A2K4MKC7_9NEIS|nr:MULTISPECIES: hypothetical protein [Chromobacterium]OHX15766.1 hypothetical protein BI343_17510 [Chromobacterium amazonense]POA97469.1 hypothetical protein C2134_16720 [Chromobacterium sinusclupearum]
MADAPLNPALRQVAEQYLGRSLLPQEAQTLMAFQQKTQNPSAQAPIQQARQQTQHAISNGHHHANANMRDLLSSIQASSSQALQVQEAEEQAILKLLEGTQSLAELRPSSLQPAMNALQPGSQLALSQIAEHLSNLARQEVEQCFQQYFGPLSAQLQEVVMKLQIKDAVPNSAAPAVPPAPAPQPTALEMPAAPNAQMAPTSTPAISATQNMADASPAPAANAPTADVHIPPAPPSMQ